MTHGQRLALEQLDEIQRAGDGALTIVDVTPPGPDDSYLVVSISIECSGMQRAPCGLPLRSRERIKLYVPPGFPFEYPAAEAPHRRFAGYPHVLWERFLCLYVSPATEWDASDGMYGFITRLDAWLRDAAQDRLDPEGAPVHPPFMRRISSQAPFIIPRVNTPAIKDAPWFGLAHLRMVSDRRVDINGWSALEDAVVPENVGAAILLPGKLSWEFPTTFPELERQLKANGVEHDKLLEVLVAAALRTPEDQPLYVVLGSKMRGIRGSGDLRQHLTVWQLPSPMTTALRIVSEQGSDYEPLRQVGHRAQKAVENFLDDIPIEWCVVREARPEIVVRRDIDTPATWFQGKAVAVWGCGALGGAVAESLARAGVAKLTLRDNSSVAPGLLPRQPYDDADVGRMKVRALADRLKRIRPEDLEVVSDTANLLRAPLDESDWTDGADLVIDAAASKAVTTKLEYVRRTSRGRIPIISMMVGPRATRGLVLLANETHSGGTADVARRAKLAVCGREDLMHFADEFWSAESGHPTFQPEPGCSAATFVGSWADVNALATSMLNLAARDLASPGLATATAHFIAQPHIDLEFPRLRQADFSWTSDITFVDPHAGYEVRVQQGAWREIQGWVEASRRQLGPEPETGGVLFGERDDAAGVLWVTEVIGPPPDSQPSRDLFVCGIGGVAEANAEKRKRTRGSVAFVGMWHTHPVSPPVPSPTDFNGVADIVLAEKEPSSKLLLLIIGGTARAALPWEAGAYVFSRPNFEELRAGRSWRAGLVQGVSRSVAPDTIGLALSGGGSRAIAFHLGCLRALHDRGILEQVRVISAVSGGSVIGAAYAYSNDEFTEFERRIMELLRRGLAAGIARRTFFSSNTPRALATVATAGLAAVGNGALRTALSMADRFRGKKVPGRLDRTDHMRPPLHRRFTRTHALEATLRDVLFGDTHLGDRRRHDMNVVINASELRTGIAFRFGSRESGAWRFGAIQGNDVAVAHAVAASAAYPVFLPAFDETLTFERRDGSVHQERVVLSDGGVVENLGVSCLEPGRGDIGLNTYAPDYILACDAGTGQFGGHQVPYGWPSRMTRAFETVFRKAHDATLSRLHTYVPAGQLRGFVLAYLGQQDRSLPAPPSDLVPRDDVMAYPTDFSAMPRRAIEQLSKRGEQLTRLLIARYCPDL